MTVMTTAQKFTSAPAIAAAAPEFTLDGPYVDDDCGREWWEETFTCRRAIAAATLDQILGSVTIDDQGQPTSVMLSSAPKILEHLLTPESIPRLRRLLADPTRPVQLETLYRAMNYVVEQITARPTGAPGD